MQLVRFLNIHTHSNQVSKILFMRMFTGGIQLETETNIPESSQSGNPPKDFFKACSLGLREEEEELSYERIKKKINLKKNKCQ